MQFQKGQSGNPAGRPRGSRNKRTVLWENLLAGEGESIVRKLMQLANGGELRAIRMCMDRLLPLPKGGSVACDMPPMHKPIDAVAALTEFFEAVRVGDLTPAEAAAVAKVVHTWMRTMGMVTFESRLRAIEKHKGIVPPDMTSEQPAATTEPTGQPATNEVQREESGLA
jgi:hypothetical protein